MKKTILSILTVAAMIVGLLAGPGGTAVSASEAAGGGSTAAGTLDSEKVMLYVGLDSDFNVVTDWIAG